MRHRGEQNHVGVVFRTTSDETKFLHLAWHHDLRCDDWSEAEEQRYTTYLLSHEIDPARLRLLAALCEYPSGELRQDSVGSFDVAFAVG